MLERIEILENNIAKLKEFKESISLAKIQENKFNEWSLRYGLFESIQIIIDISCHIVNKYNLGNAKSYGECVVLLEQANYIDASLKDKLLQIIGLRNILIHEYITIDIEKLYGFLDLLEDFRMFVDEVKGYV